MIWLAKALRGPQTWVVAVTAGLVAGFLHGNTAPIPSISAGGLAPVPLVAVLALIPTAAILWAWTGLPTTVVTVSTRRTPAFLVAAATIIIVLAALSAAVGSGGTGVAETARNSIGLFGVAAIARRYLGTGGGIGVAVALVFAAFLFGPTGAGEAQPWAFLLRGSTDATSWIIAGVLGGAGALLTCYASATIAAVEPD